MNWNLVLNLVKEIKLDYINEVEENKVENVEKEIENASLVEVTNKLDGSM